MGTDYTLIAIIAIVAISIGGEIMDLIPIKLPAFTRMSASPHKQIEIAEKLGVNKRTVLRDFKELKEMEKLNYRKLV